MSAWSLFLTAFLVGFTGALMPGPLLTLNIKESFSRGAWTGPKLMLGHALLEIAMIIAVLLGFGRFLGMSAVKGPIGLLGGLVLLWMAQGMIREAAAGITLPTAAAGQAKRGMPLPVAGAIVSISNPYWTIWWATVGLTYLTQARELALYGVALFFIGHILADLTWYTGVSIAVAGGRRIFSDRAYQVVVFICGLFLVYVGIWFIDSALGFLGVWQPSQWLRILLHMG